MTNWQILIGNGPIKDDSKISNCIWCPMFKIALHGKYKCVDLNSSFNSSWSGVTFINLNKQKIDRNGNLRGQWSVICLFLNGPCKKYWKGVLLFIHWRFIYLNRTIDHIMLYILYYNIKSTSLSIYMTSNTSESHDPTVFSVIMTSPM